MFGEAENEEPEQAKEVLGGAREESAYGGGSAQDIVPRLLYGALIAAGFVGVFLALQQSLDEYWVLLLVSLYAAMGVFFLLCAAFGVCRFGLREGDKAAAADVLDNLAPAIALTDKKGRFIYGNKSYRQLAGAALRTPEILLGRDERTAGAACRLSEAARQGRALCEILHFSRNPFAAEIGAGVGARAEGAEAERCYLCCADVRPFFSGGYALAMWTISESAESKNRGDSIRAIQEAVSHFDSAPAGLLSWDGAGQAVFFNAFLARLVRYDFSSASGAPSLADLFGAENAQAVFAWGQALKRRRAEGLSAEAAAMAIEPADGRGGFKRLYFYADAAGGEDALFHALVLPEEGAFAPPAVFARQKDCLGENSGENLAPPQGRQTSADMLALEEYFQRSPIALAMIKRGRQMMEANGCFKDLFGLSEHGAPAREEAAQAENGQGGMAAPAAADESLAGFFAALAEPYRRKLMQEIKTALEAGAQPACADAVLAEPVPRSIRLYITPLSGHGAVVIAAVETTRQRALEQQMEHSQKMQAVGQLAGGIAHDFNNVLTAVIMSCDLLLSSHRSSDPSHPDIINIKHNAERAASLVRQLLAFSRRQTLQLEVLDITDMLADLRLLAVRLAGSSVTLKIEHGSSLWPVRADQAQLQRVIMNLVANARDAMPQGGALRIRTDNISEAESRRLPYRDFAPGDYVLIEVADSGGGIAPEIMEKIFDPFFTTKEIGKGTGLGLSTVYGIIRQTGGYIYCRSEPGKGTVFSIYLPRFCAAAESGEDAVYPYIEENSGAAALSDSSIYPAGDAGGGPPFYVEEGARRAPSARGGKAENGSSGGAFAAAADLSGSANVLLVEDEDAVRMGGVKALQSRGYTVFEAESGVEALRIMKERQGAIDIVVSDVVMPEMDGPTLLKELRQSYPWVKFIFVSGYAREAFAKNLPDDADFAFLPKPFSLKQLASAVKDMLQGGAPAQ